MSASASADEPSWLVQARGIADALDALFHPHVEVVVHDLESDTIAVIAHPFSGRRRGDPSLLSDLDAELAEAGSDTIGPYEKVTPDGRRLTSVSVVLRDDTGTARGLLCVNWDRSPTDALLTAVAALAGPPVGDRPKALFDRDWREQIALAVDEWCRDNGVQRRHLVRTDRLAIVASLDRADLFATRHAAEHVAEALGISRATVYSLRRESR